MTEGVYHLDRVPRMFPGKHKPSPVVVVCGGKINPQTFTPHDAEIICAPQGEAAQEAFQRDLFHDEDKD